MWLYIMLICNMCNIRVFSMTLRCPCPFTNTTIKMPINCKIMTHATLQTQPLRCLSIAKNIWSVSLYRHDPCYLDDTVTLSLFNKVSRKAKLKVISYVLVINLKSDSVKWYQHSIYRMHTSNSLRTLYISCV